MRLGKKDRAVIKAFIAGREAEGLKLRTDGERLDGIWMGGNGIAEWTKGPRVGSIVFNDLGSRAAQQVQRALKKEFGSGRLYHVVSINARTKRKEYLTATPEPHHPATVIMRKWGPQRSKDVRIQLEEV